MSHAKNKVNWCLKKAEKELKEGDTHRGLAKIKPDKNKIIKHMEKAEHDLKAGMGFKKIDFSDWSAVAFFYSMYHCLLAIAVKFGYESRNQECTFALIENLIEEKKIDFDKKLLDKIASLEKQRREKESTSVEIREEYQYGTKLALKENLYEDLYKMAKEVLSKTKEIIEE